jgi:hypothetical protein
MVGFPIYLHTLSLQQKVSISGAPKKSTSSTRAGEKGRHQASAGILHRLRRDQGIWLDQGDQGENSYRSLVNNGLMMVKWWLIMVNNDGL